MNQRNGVGPGAWHVSQAVQVLLWGACVIGLGLWGAFELAELILRGAA